MTASRAARIGRNLGLGAVTFLAVLLVWRVAHPSARLQGRTPAAPSFSIESLSGSGRVELASYAGRVIVLSFWASWCGPCREELPMLEREWRRWRDDVVTFVGVDVRDDVGDARKMLASTGVTFPAGHDEAYTVERLYDVDALPHTFVIAPSGHITAQFAGTVRAEQLEAAITKALGGDDVGRAAAQHAPA